MGKLPTTTIFDLQSIRGRVREGATAHATKAASRPAPKGRERMKSPASATPGPRGRDFAGLGVVLGRRGAPGRPGAPGDRLGYDRAALTHHPARGGT